MNPATVSQLLALPRDAAYVTCEDFAKVQGFVGAMGRSDVLVTTEYWVQDLEWVDQPGRPVVLDVGLCDGRWVSKRFRSAVEVLRLLGRLA